MDLEVKHFTFFSKIKETCFLSFYLRYSHFNKQFEKIQVRSWFIYIDGVAIIINIVIMHAITDGDDGVCHVMENQGSTRRK